LKRSNSIRAPKSLAALRPARAAALTIALAGVTLAACSNAGSKGAGGEADADLGSARMTLQLGAGETLDSVAYTITGPGGYAKTGTADVSHSTTVSFVVGAIPAGTGYSISVTGTSVAGDISCAGSASFDVMAHATTAVALHLACHQATRLGSVSVNGSINVCPVLDGITALPGEAIVGFPIALSAAAHDSDAGPSPLSYHWTVSSGTLDDPGLASPTFTCLFPGPVTITAAVSDGDPAASCADSASVQVTCSPAAPQLYAWVELGSAGQILARAITPDAACPPIAVDGHSRPMNVRIAAGTEPLRPTASTPALSKPSEFPVTACELTLPAGTSEAIVGGRLLPLPKAVPNRIVVIGDTGCRMKVGNPFQACSDPTEWPFQEIAANAAALHPDLVLHVGDYHYRENACPADIAGCQGSPWGYGWDVWEQDLFKPAANLMAAAPWILVRGNHEECARGGQGWFRFLDTLPYDESRSCNDPANDTIANYNTPYAVPVGTDTQVIVFDSAKSTATALDPTRAADAPIFARYQAQFQTVAALAANPNMFSIFSNHHPILGFTPAAGARPTGGQASLQSVMSATFGGGYYPPGIKLALHGHVHLFQAIDFQTPHPVTLLSGNGGDNLDANLPDPFPLGPASAGGVEPAPGAVVDRIAHTSTYGFMTLDRAPGGWTMTEYRHDGAVLDTCSIDSASDKITCASYGFVH
jgi:hypothetical protein